MSKTEQCKKISFQDDDKEYSLCTDAKKVGEDKYLLFENKFIDKISRDILLYPKINKYIAVKVSNDKYALRPVFDDEKVDKQDFIPVKRSVSKGSYGSVDLYPTQKVVVKNFIQDEYNFGDINFDFIKEVAIYKFLESNCVPNFYNYGIENDKYNIEIELGNITLNNLISKNAIDKFRTMIPDIMFNLLTCLRDINNLGLIHGDIKLDNIILDNQGKPKFIDWGLAMPDFTKLQNTPRGWSIYTPGYSAPEVIIFKYKRYDGKMTYNYKADIFALGVVFMRLYLGREGSLDTFVDLGQNKARPHPNGLVEFIKNLTGKKLTKNPVDSFVKIFTEYRDSSALIKTMLIKKGIESNVANLISHMLDINPETRWNHKQLLESNIFKNKIIKPVSERKYISKCKIPSINQSWKSKGLNRENAIDIFRTLSLKDDMINNTILENCSLSALFLAMELLDFYIYLKQSVEIDLEKIIFSMIVLTSKIHINKGYDYINLNNCNFILKENCRNEITQKQFVTIQEDILNTFEGDVLHYTFYDYLSYSKDISPLTNKVCKNKEEFLKNRTRIFDCILSEYYTKDDLYRE